MADKEYHYRVVAVSEVEVSPGHVELHEFDGADQTFTTQGAGESALPDGRHWELVSPTEKLGALFDSIGQSGAGDGGVIQAAAGGGAISYVATSPTEPEPAGYSNETQVFSARGQQAWETHDLTVPHASATRGSVGPGLEYRFFSEDLSSALVQPFGAFVALSPQASEQTAYLHDDTTGAYTPLVTRADDSASPFEPFGEFGGFGQQEEGHACPPELICGPQFVGAERRCRACDPRGPAWR